MSARRRNARGLTTATILLALAAPVSVLAGDVTVSVGGGTLKLKGSADGDQVTIDNRGGLMAGEIRVTPEPGTTLNGMAGEQVFAGVTGGIKAALGDGADLFVIDDMPLVPGPVTVAMGKGPDRVRIQFSTIADKVKIDLGAGTNAVELCESTFNASVTVKAGAPVDGLAEAQCPGGAATANTPFGSVGVLESVDVAGDLSLKGGKGFDGFGVRDATIEGNAKVALGAGTNGFGTCDVDYRGNLTIGMGGKDEATVNVECVGTDFTAQASGNAAIAMANIDLAGTLKVKTGKGGDAVAIIGVSMASAKLDVGAGVNFLGFLSVSLDGDLSAKSGKHSDTFTFENIGVDGNVKLTLGAGNNTLATNGGGVDGDLTVKAGKGDDTIDTSSITVGGTRKVDGGGGMDTITP